ncbi:MAG: hypothetical protein J6Q96_01050, partial [Bacteroidales bacterium]|nr:hypothetical protein [Bacteroidales bacterium]
AAIAGAATALLALGASTKEYRENQAKLSAAFETAGASADAAKGVYNDLYRVLGDDDRAVEAAGHLAKLSTNQQELSEWTNICQGVYATFGDSLPIEGLTEAVNHSSKLGSIQSVLADALEWSGVNVDEFNERLASLKTESEREELIRTTLNGLYDEASKNYEKSAEGVLAQNEAQAKLNEKMAVLGEKMAPINTALTEMGIIIAEQLAPIITQFMDEHGEDIKNFLVELAEKIGAVINWIVDNWDFISTLAIIITAIAVALSVFSTAMAIVNAVMAASPVTWIVLAIVAAITLLVTIIVLVIKYWDEIKAIAVKVWEKIKEVWGKAGEWFKGIWEGIKNAFSAVGTFFGNIFSTAYNKIKTAFSKVTGFFKGIWNSIKEIFSSVGTAIGNAVSGAVKGAINKVLSTAVGIINGFISAINLAIDVINAIPGVSISRLKKLEVPKLAKGGIVDSATIAMIGEQGKEAVVPLENNTEWIDMLAKKIGGGNNKPVSIVLQVDGKKFAETSIATINDLTRQTGSLKLNIG